MNMKIFSMKYHSRLKSLLILLAVITNSILSISIYYKAKDILFKQIQSKALSIASTTASFINGELHKDLNLKSDEDSPSYKKIEQELKTARDANRREDTYVKYMYTMIPSLKNPDILMFGVDPEEEFKDKSHIGDIYKGESGSPIKIDQYYVDSNFTVDQWGMWMSAHAPIKDKAGHAVASLGIDINAHDVMSEINSLKMIIFFSLSLSIIISFVLSIGLSRQISQPFYIIKDAMERLGNGDLSAKLSLSKGMEFGEIANYFNNMADKLKERERLRKGSSRYLSNQVVDNMLRSEDMLALNGTRKRVTILFSDIRNFTTISEKLQPEDIVIFLNEYFEKMVEVIDAHKGILNKMMGDGLMCIFNAPEDDLYHEKNAVKAALSMRKELYNLCQKWEDEGRNAIQIGIGIHSGSAVIGNIGSTKRMEYTAIGDTVNLASRIESATKEAGVDILISEATYNEVKGLFSMAKIGSIDIKGRSSPVTVYSVEGE